MFNFREFTDKPHPHKQETRGLDTIQGYFSLSLVATSLLSRDIFRQSEICEEKKNPETRKNREYTYLLVFL